ncbi:hypothetical protein N0V90_010821 [Kalmusia sp. IMI 367209]|nr:hypothetical protein N0V90_010821 [Kalmusia sp. IMI 367209]
MPRLRGGGKPNSDRRPNRIPASLFYLAGATRVKPEQSITVEQWNRQKPKKRIGGLPGMAVYGFHGAESWKAEMRDHEVQTDPEFSCAPVTRSMWTSSEPVAPPATSGSELPTPKTGTTPSTPRAQASPKAGFRSLANTPTAPSPGKAAQNIAPNLAHNDNAHEPSNTTLGGARVLTPISPTANITALSEAIGSRDTPPRARKVDGAADESDAPEALALDDLMKQLVEELKGKLDGRTPKDIVKKAEQKMGRVEKARKDDAASTSASRDGEGEGGRSG